MREPFLSIIIPVYNKAQYLNKCIQSIVEQSFTDWEIILVDDGSTDSSPSICDQWSVQDARIKVIHQKNAGVSTARNNGLKYAKGEYIQFTDADDWWQAGALLTLHKEIKKNIKPRVLVFGLTKFFRNGTEFVLTPKREGKIERKKFFSNLIYEQASSGVYGCVANKLVSRRFLLDSKICFTSAYKLMEDYDFFLSVYASSNEIAQSIYAGYYYLQSADNSSSCASFVPQREDSIKILIKSYSLVNSICGVTPSDTRILSRLICGQIIATLLEMEPSCYQMVQQRCSELMKLFGSIPMEKAESTSLFFTIIITLFKYQNYHILYITLRFRKIVRTVLHFLYTHLRKFCHLSGRIKCV